jgi:hypothetical protein
MQQKGIKNKNSFVKEVPNEIDVLNEYRQKYDLKRKYATPILERDGDIHCFDEEFYNKARQPEFIRQIRNLKEFGMQKNL